MGILRSDIVSHSQLEPTGSVTFDGTGDNLSLSLANGGIGEGDFTLEYFVYQNTLSDYQTHFAVTRGSTGFNVGTDSNGVFTLYDQVSSAARKIEVSGAIEINRWYHWAFVRSGSTITGYLDGEAIGLPYSQSVNYSGTTCTIGSLENNSEYMNGFISNLRLVKGAIYKNNFTPPKFELKNVPGTLLLCCQSSSSATTASVKPGTITANGNAAASAFIPDLKKDITDTGPVFGENTVFDTLSYMVPPGGKTDQRGRGRAVMGGFYKAPNTYHTNIEYLSIQSLGNSIKFGDLTLARTEIAACSSSTRALFAGGTVPGPVTGGTKQNIIDYVTIATTANAINFGDLTDTIRTLGGCSNETRGIFGGGIDDPARLNTIDYVTIASAGNGADFGDLSEQRRNISAHSSTTRGIFAGGLNPGPAYVNTIDYITIATTGDATNFGDLTALVYATTSCSNSTRGVIMGGTNPSGATNVIDYVTIATTGDGTDFGDLTVARADGAGVASPTRGLMVGGDPATNTIDYITIATTGNASDFGDASVGESRGQAGSSDCHGGIS